MTYWIKYIIIKVLEEDDLYKLFNIITGEWRRPEKAHHPNRSITKEWPYGRTGNLIVKQSPWYNRTGWLGVKHQFTYLLHNNAVTTQIKRKFRKNERGQRMAIKTNKVFYNKEMRPTRRGSSEQIKETKPKRQTEAKTQLCRGRKKKEQTNKQANKHYFKFVSRFGLAVRR